MFPAEERIGPDLLLHSVRDERDIERFVSVLTRNLSALFPSMQAYLYPAYHYYGPGLLPVVVPTSAVPEA